MDGVQNPPPPYSWNHDFSLYYTTPIDETTSSNTGSEYPGSWQESRDFRAGTQSGEQRLLEEGNELWEGERSDGGIQLPNAYIENNGDARGVEFERRNGLEARDPLDKTIELKEGESDIVRVCSRPTSARQTPLLSLCARILPKLPSRQKTMSWSLRIKHFLGLNPGFCPGALSIRRAEHNAVFSSGPNQHKCPYCGLIVRARYPTPYTHGWPNYSGISRAFILESHLPVGTKYPVERRSCLMCWDYEGVWAGAMDKEEWEGIRDAISKKMGIGCVGLLGG